MRGLSKPSHQLRRLARVQSILPRAFTPPLLAAQHHRHGSSLGNACSSGASAINIEAIRAEMLARPPHIHRDMMYPINSHLLTKTLSDFLPEECYSKQEIPSRDVYRGKEHASLKTGEIPVLPAGHHLVYFPLHLRHSELCPDGTDPYHSPLDTPCTRRMWAGGSIQGLHGMSLDERLAICLERIADVAVRGPPGAEKIFVDVLREYTTQADFERRFNPESMKLIPHDELSRDASEREPRGLTEHRTLVFMRTPNDEERAMNLRQEQKTIRAPSKSDYSVTLTPTPTLLFHYSALTYNPHRIHIDRSYCREVEGHPDPLVHGPLSLTLMLSVLQSRLAADEVIDRINYRNLAPLYVEQAMRICVARQKPRDSRAETPHSTAEADTPAGREKWDVWVENHRGGLCVRGTAETARLRF